MCKEMPGITDSMYLTILKDSLLCLEEDLPLSNNWINFSREVNIGKLNGFPILTTGQAMNIIYFLFGYLVWQVDQIWLKNTVEWS